MVALGLTLQYGVARIMNLAYGELVVAAAFGAWWLYTANAVSPLAGLIVIVPVAFRPTGDLSLPAHATCPPRQVARGAGGRLDPVHLRPSVRSPGHRLVVLRRPVLQLRLSRSCRSTSSEPRWPPTGWSLLPLRSSSGSALYLALTRTRAGTAVRAVAIDPRSARLVGIDVPRMSAMAFAPGGALCAAAGVLVSMFLDLQRSAAVSPSP